MIRYWRAWAMTVAGVIVVAAILTEARTQAAIEDARDARQDAARAVLPVTQAIRDQRDRAAQESAQGTRTVGVADPGGPSRGAAALARDTGEPALDDQGGGLIVVARYQPAGADTVAARRSGLVGYSLTPLDLSQVLDPLTGGSSMAVLGPTRQVGTSSDFTTRASGGTSFALPLSDGVAPGWRLTVVVPRRGVPTWAWFTALLTLIAAAAAATTSARRTRQEHRQESDALRRARADSALAELAAVAQSSLDLAEVLPASFAVIESALELDGATLLGGNARPTFVWRDAPTSDEPARSGQAPVPAGCCVDMPLARAGRSLGVLRVRPRRDLDELDLRTLSTAAVTLSSAVANADAYAHQRALITRMRALDELKTVFVATASHELRTPVAAISGYASMLTENWADLDPQTGLLYAQRVDNNAQRLAALVEHLLDFSRLEQGGARAAESESLDLGAEVQEFVERQPDLTPDHELLVGVQPGVVVRGSRLAIERVVANLVGNAVKYSPAGSRIRIRVFGDDAAHLVVDDEGPGVPEDERERIFSRFFRGKGEAVVRTRGAGLGLSIVTEFAASMAGTVSIAAAPTGGTRFEVTYPLDDPRPLQTVPDRGDSDVLA